MDTPTIIAFVLFSLAGISTLIHTQLIFTRIDNKYPILYKKLGKPELFTNNWFRGMRTNVVIIRMIFSRVVSHGSDEYLGRLLIGLRVSFSIVLTAWLGLLLSILIIKGFFA